MRLEPWGGLKNNLNFWYQIGTEVRDKKSKNKARLLYRGSKMDAQRQSMDNNGRDPEIKTNPLLLFPIVIWQRELESCLPNHYYNSIKL